MQPKSMYSAYSYPIEFIRTPQGKRPIPPPNYRNIVLVLSYQGDAFCGYQYQPHNISVQEVLTKAWHTLTKEQILLFGCSRLDAKVNANHFILNFYSNTNLSCERIIKSLNGILCTIFKVPIAIYNAYDAPSSFHARFDAQGKHYRYLIWYGAGQHAALCSRTWNIRSTQKPENIPTILKEFQGTHDFAAFRAHDCQAKTTLRSIIKAQAWQHNQYPELWILDFFGTGFLKNMVRNMVGTCIDIAINKLDISIIQQAFAHKNRCNTGQCAPAHALTLEQVYYDTQKFTEDAEKNWVGLL